MGVPAHDERDYDFAATIRFTLQVRRRAQQLVMPMMTPTFYVMTRLSPNPASSSIQGEFSSLDSQTAKTRIAEFMEGEWHRQTNGQLSFARLVLEPPALLGLPNSGDLL
jgi:hypothetical protein